MIVSILYLTARKLDIMFAVCLLAIFQSCPKESQVIVVKQIILYLVGTYRYGLWYPKIELFDTLIRNILDTKWKQKVQVDIVNF